MSGASLSTLIAGFGGGVVAFFAPCAFPLLPGYVGYYVDRADVETPLAGAFLRGIAACVGVFAVFGVVAVVVVSSRRALVNFLRFVEPLIGILLIGLGLAMVSDRMPTLRFGLPARRTSVLGFAVFGGGYSIAATGCMVGVFAAIVIEAVTLSFLEGLLVIVGYAAGLGLPLVAATLLAAVGYGVVARSLPRYTEQIERIAGGVVVLAGLVQLHSSIALLI